MEVSAGPPFTPPDPPGEGEEATVASFPRASLVVGPGLKTLRK